MKKILILAVFVCGCNATGYHPRSFEGGYTDMKMQDDIYQVSFSGNGFTGSQRAGDFALLRCAEVTLDAGCSYFVILNDKSGIATGTVTTPATTFHSGSIDSYGGGASYSGYSQTVGGQSYNVSKPVSRYVIRTLKEKPSELFCYDAKQICDNIRSHYKLN